MIDLPHQAVLHRGEDTICVALCAFFDGSEMLRHYGRRSLLDGEFLKVLGDPTGGEDVGDQFDVRLRRWLEVQVATPTVASLSAGASLMPSPSMTTTRLRKAA